MALLSTQEVTAAGTAVTFAAAASGGDTFAPGNGCHLRIKNGDSAPHTATVTSVVPCSQGFHHDIVITVAAGAEEEAGPFDSGRYADGAGHAAIAYSAVTSVTVAVVHLP
jgi:hypothetical protein